ncbi:MAG: F0F1 ATP synthase subunit B [Actinomycetota bacterium]|nr:MAG: F0F1 ATP synthase subunit B [Actinomycetota bacterium]
MQNLLAASAHSDVPNVLAVPVHELVIGLISFFVVFGLLAKFALPKIKQTLAERTEAIEGGIRRAEEAQAEANRLAEDYRAQLAEARNEAAAIRAQAQADKTAIIESARAEAAEAAAAVTARAEAQLQAERASILNGLRREVGDLAVTLAGKVVGESLSDDTRAAATVERFIADLEQQAELSAEGAVR